jgi:hypothetical protein
METSSSLNATSFVYSQTRRDSYFELILTTCVDVYHAIIGSAIQLANDENTIRDEFLKYLQDMCFKQSHELKNLKFDKETVENSGRADIRVLPTKDEYINDEEYYLIECKRLDSKNLNGIYGLNAEYIKNGICRFVSGYYSTYYGCNAMFGFVVESVNNIDNELVGGIKSLLNTTMTNDHGIDVNAQAKDPLQYTDFANGYPYSYISTHTHISGKELVLYHLMFDFSNNII